MNYIVGVTLFVLGYVGLGVLCWLFGKLLSKFTDKFLEDKE